ncbi:PP2C family serine/threonine-protein phosphatase [Synechocystis sp. LKSZ1]|uniref:PP2C family protein-serine/threonine phosphatase n=1 Tax=Synechocystis sp. LKSZ1 TaxID=3144951 RepID=UPI00336BAF6E
MAPICCPNPRCQTPNPLSHQHCETCQTLLLKRYLWVVGDWIKAYPLGQMIDERYELVQPRILLDTQPALLIDGPEEIPAYITPYLKLFPYRLHVPQVYDFFPSTDAELDLSLWFLDYGPIPLNEQGEPLYPELLPALTSQWITASPLQQLTWLWQMAQLWHPFQAQGVVSSLLQPEFLKVNGAQVQLRELQVDEHQFYEPKHLASVWGPLLLQAHAAIADFCQTLHQQLEQGKIHHDGQLLDILGQGLEQLASQYQHHYQICTRTDRGPNRDHNEDACYPPTQVLQQGQQLLTTLTIVCDGVGGQEGGEIASQWVVEHLPLAIANQPELGGKAPHRRLAPLIETCLNQVNDQLNQRNNQENRQERERMGTTLVMSLAQQHHLYIVNVGDSRCYWITPQSCLQATVDDDLACREVRLGYMLYRDALKLPRSGALTQVIGLDSSQRLHPSIQQVVVPENSLFLLCSDGLCDFYRVDQYWPRLLAPVLSGEMDLLTAGDALIQMANEVNGHDNVTVALVHCQIQAPETFQSLAYPHPGVNKVGDKSTLPPVVVAESPEPLPALPSLTLTPPSVPASTPQNSVWALSLSGLVGLLLLSWFVVLAFPDLFSRPTDSPSPAPTLPITP